MSNDSINRSLDDILTKVEIREILGALQRANGQRTAAARMLGISRSRLYRRIDSFKIDLNEVGAATSGDNLEDRLPVVDQSNSDHLDRERAGMATTPVERP